MVMPTASTVVQAKDAIVAGLPPRLEGSGATVHYAFPGEAGGPKRVWLASELSGDSDVPTLKAARKRRDESYDLLVILEVLVDGGSERIAEVDCEQLYAELDGLLADDPRLGLESIISAVLTGHSRHVGALPSRGHGCRIAATVHVQARLS